MSEEECSIIYDKAYNDMNLKSGLKIHCSKKNGIKFLKGYLNFLRLGDKSTNKD